MKSHLGGVALAFLSLSLSLAGQTADSKTATTTVTAQVPRLIRFAGTLKGIDTGATGGVVGMTFSLYADQTEGAALWSEVQNVQVGADGTYAVLLGSTKPDGLPAELFASAQAQWLGVRVEAQAEQPRVMLLSVPYALKAADAETFGGKPPSAYTLNPVSGGSSPVSGGDSTPQNNSPHPLPITGSGTPNYIPIWTNASNLSSSVIYQSGIAIGIGTTAPTGILDVLSNSSSVFAVSGTNISPNSVGVFGFLDATSGNGMGVSGVSNSPDGIGVKGANTATSGLAVGVAGTSQGSTGVGVFGIASATTGQAFGVEGQVNDANAAGGNFLNSATDGTPAVGLVAYTGSDGGIAIHSIAVAPSTTGANDLISYPIGVWGDTNVNGGVAVAATTDDAIAIQGLNNAGNIATADFENETTSDDTAPIFAAHSSHYGGTCLINVSGDLECNGSESAVVAVDGGSRKVALYAVQSPENWFEDLGSGQLSNGSATVELEATFMQTVNSNVDYHVFLTPTGNCKGLYVTNKSAGSFEVHEIGGGTSSSGFDYRIVARRKGYENIRLADRTRQFNPDSYRGKTERKATAAVRSGNPLPWSMDRFRLPAFATPQKK